VRMAKENHPAPCVECGGAKEGGVHTLRGDVCRQADALRRLYWGGTANQAARTILESGLSFVESGRDGGAILRLGGTKKCHKTKIF